MKLSFVETMRGWITLEDQRAHPLSFHLRAEGDLSGRFTVRGLIALPPLVSEAALSGTLEISPLRRTISYDLAFAADDGRALRLVAAKHPSIFAPLQGMTEMPVELLAADPASAVVTRLGQGTMRFALADLPSFGASFLWRGTVAERRLEADRTRLERRRLIGASA